MSETKEEYSPTVKNGLLFRKVRKDKGVRKNCRFVRAIKAAVREWKKK